MSCLYLNDEGFVAQAWRCTDHAHVACFIHKVFDSMEDALVEEEQREI